MAARTLTFLVTMAAFALSALPIFADEARPFRDVDLFSGHSLRAGLASSAEIDQALRVYRPP